MELFSVNQFGKKVSFYLKSAHAKKYVKAEVMQ